MSQIPADLVERVVEVTGTSETIAKNLLAGCCNDVEAAVTLFFEGGVVDVGNDSVVQNVGPEPVRRNDMPPLEGDDGVRPPIAPIREQLISPENDNFYPTAPPSSTSARLSRNARIVKVCPLRDFAREGALMEEQLQAVGNCSALNEMYTAASNCNSKRDSADPLTTAAHTSAESKRRRLEDLYRPPTDIAFAGSFQAARTRSEILKRWLLVNIQSDNFDSQLLNRDVWSDKSLRKLLKRQFLLWQVEADSSEGRRFVAFYKCTLLPYLCVIDPRTGEEMWKSAEPKQENVMTDLQQFLHNHKDFIQEYDEAGPSTSGGNSSTTPISLDSDDEVNASPSPVTNTKKNNKLMELSEEEQIEVAIKNSLRENGIGNGTTTPAAEANNKLLEENSDVDSVEEEFQENDINSIHNHHQQKQVQPAQNSYEEQLGTATNDLTMLKLRLISANGGDEVVQLRWPSDTRIMILRNYIAQVHLHIPLKGYKLISAFPRKTLEAEHDNCTLKEMGLHPSANLHITLND